MQKCRLLDFVKQKKIGFHAVKYLVLDEADRMLDMGFMPDVKRIVNDPNMPAKVGIYAQSLIKKLLQGSRQTLMFSATFPDPIRKVSSEFLHAYLFLSGEANLQNKKKDQQKRSTSQRDNDFQISEC